MAKVTKLSNFWYDGIVHDLTVQNTHTYNIDGLAVHNSAAGVLLTYLLGITNVDPIQYNLSLDRFLTLDRIQSGKLPDIDLDLPSRDLLVGDNGNNGWLHERFGDNYCQVSTDITLKLKSAIKDVSRVRFGHVPPSIEAMVSKMAIPPQGVSDRDYVFGYVGPDGTPVKGAIETDPYLQAFVQQYPDLWEVAQKALSLTRSLSRHASAYLICNEPVQNFIPTTSVSGIRVTQFTAPSAEEAGALKYDFLVVNSLKDVSDALMLIRESQGFVPESGYVLDGKSVPGFRTVKHGSNIYDIWNLPEDQDVFNDICEGNTETVFQFNTPAAKQWLRYFNEQKADGNKLLDSIMALSNFTALDRPGPLDAQMTDETGDTHNMLVEYTRRAKLGRGNYKSDLPVLDELVPETYGIIIYQEQLTRIFKELGGTTGMEAENFRVHVSKKQMAKVAEDREIFMRGAVPKVGEHDAVKLWDMMCTFAQYGFNCIAGNQLVKTEAGNIFMADIVSHPEKHKVAYLNVDGSVSYETPSIAAYMGQKEVFEVALEDGTTIRATGDHKFLYRNEWVTLKNLVDMKKVATLFACQRIVSTHSLGIQDVYDIEMPTTHNFVLSNGVVAHNCSHAVSYVHLSYACAYLKHHFPLEWWTAVLRNADKNEISEKFWPHCGHLINLPDIKLSKDNFAVVNGRIQAPTSLLQGIGATAHEELVEVSKGANNIEELFQNIYARRVSKGKDGKLGRSSLHRSVMYTLIVSGTMDSMFPIGSTMLDKLMSYEAARTVYEEMCKKKPEDNGEKKRKSKPRKPKVPEPVLPAFVNLTAMQIYQLRKSILPAYSQDLYEMVCNSGMVNRVGMGYVFPFGDKMVKIVKAKTVDDFEAMTAWPTSKQVVLGLPCYVQSDERRMYGPQKNKQMAKLTLESSGKLYEFVKWPERNQNNLSEEFDSELTGTVGIAILTKYSAEKPFVVNTIVTVQAPFEKPKEESNG